MKTSTDKERIDFLETLRDRTAFFNKKNPIYYLSTDIHITGPDRCTLYARTIGSYIEFYGHGASVRSMIDAAMEEYEKTQAQK